MKSGSFSCFKIKTIKSAFINSKAKKYYNFWVICPLKNLIKADFIVLVLIIDVFRWF